MSEDEVENSEPYESESDDSTEEEVGQGIVGDRVEVLWDRDGKYYPGVIARVRRASVVSSRAAQGELGSTARYRNAAIDV